MIVEFNTKQELCDYLNKFDFDSVKDTKLSSVYFLVEWDDQLSPVFFWHWSDCDAWFASPCEFVGLPLKNVDLNGYVKDIYNEDDWEEAYEYEKTMVIDGWHYEIHNPQVSPFLPDKIKILDAFSDSRCLGWMLDRWYKNR